MAGGNDSKQPDTTVTDVEAAKLLLDAWKFRQAHAWSSLTRYFVAAALISVSPYGLNSDLLNKLSSMVVLLPIVGGLLALAAVWLYAAEYIRAQAMNHAFGAILKRYDYYAPIGAMFLKPRIGWTTVFVLVASVVVLAVINVAIIWTAIRT